MISKIGNRIISLAVVFCLIFSYLSLTPVHAEGLQPTGTLTLETDKTKVTPGDTFTVTLKSGDTKFESMKLAIHYDSAMVECVSYETKHSAALANDVTAKSYVRLTSASAVETAAPDGVLLTMVFKVKDNAIGTITFEPEINFWKATNPDNPKVGLDIQYEMVNKATEIVSKLPPTDISALTDLIAKAKGYSADQYTEASFAALVDAIKASEAITEDNTKEEVQQQIDVLQAAIDGLKEAVDKTALQAAVKAVPEDYTATYTPETAAKVTAALEEANVLLNDRNLENTEANQKAIAAAATALNSAIEGLQAIPNKDTLKSKLDAANTMLNNTEAVYMDSDKEALKNEVAKAQGVFDNENATEAQVSDAINALDKAMAGMRFAADKEGFDEKIALIRENLSVADYTTSSWKAVQEALNAADQLSEKMEKGQVPLEDASKAYQAVENAVKALVPVAGEVEKTALDQAITNAKSLSKDHYTADSWKSVEEALDNAEKVKANLSDTSKDQVVAATKALTAAISELVTVTVDEKTGVVVNGLPAGEKITVADKIKDKDALSDVDKAVKEAKEFANAKETKTLFLADIKPEVSENIDGTFTLTIPLNKDQLDYDVYYVGHKDDKTGEFTWTAVTPKDGKIVLQVTSFSEFTVVGMINPEAPKPSTNPNDGNTTESNINGAANRQSGSNSSGQNAGTGLAENQSNSLLLASGALILAVAGLIAYKKKYYTK